MPQALTYLKETASQTAGPYVHIGLIPHMAGFDIFQNNFDNVLAGADTAGEHIVIEGRVIDGTGALVRDAMLEIWQADANGRYAHPADRQPKPRDANFRGWGRGGTDFDTGVYRFETIKPGASPWREGRISAPHINFWIVARGINIGLSTRMYFPEEQAANASDPVLEGIELRSRAQTLIARREERNGKTVYVFDIVLQGDNETVFFDI
jgi:protocatechuate 3,4-dioxygenase alpha subunit